MSDRTATTERAIRTAVCRSLCDHLDLPETAAVDIDASFTDLGLDSTGVFGVCGDLEAALGAPVPPEKLFDFPSVRKLAHHLVDVCADTINGRNQPSA